MATYPIKMLRDEDRQPFVPFTNAAAVVDSNSVTLQELMTNGKYKIQNNVTTSSAGKGVLDAYQGKVLNDKFSNYVPLSQKGVANGVATLDGDAKVPTAQLPSYVDDVIEAYTRSGATALSSTWLSLTDGGAALTPEKGKIYVIMSSGSYQNKQYRWGGSTYVLCNPSDVNSVNGFTGVVVLKELTIQKNGTQVGDKFNGSANKTINITVPTKTSDITNDSGFISDISMKVDKAGDTMTGHLYAPAVRIKNVYYGLARGLNNGTPVETIVHTGIQWRNGSHMPVLHITGYAYGLQSPIEFKVGFYIFENKVGWCGVTNMGAWKPNVYLFKRTVNNVDYVSLGLAGSCYYLQLNLDVQDEMGGFNYINTDTPSLWSVEFSSSTGVIPAPDGGTTCLSVPYRADILKDNNTTYTFATGDNNGQFKVTPSDTGTAQNISIKGLGSNAYTSTAYLPLTGGDLSGDLNLKVSDGSASPAITFQRGTLTDNYNDWKIQDVTGNLIFSQRGSNSTEWSTVFAVSNGGDITGVKTISGKAEKATGDKNGLDITNYIKGLSISGRTITYTKGDNTTGTLTTQDTVYTLPVAGTGINGTLGGIKVGSGLSIDGTTGVLSATGGGTADNVEWSGVLNKPTNISYWVNDTGYITKANVMAGATASTAGDAGVVPKPNSGDQAKFLRGDGQWAVAATTDTKNTAGATDTSSKIYLVGALAQTANPQTYSDNEVFATNGVLQAKEVSINAGVNLVYNSTDQCLEFNFA